MLRKFSNFKFAYLTLCPNSSIQIHSQVEFNPSKILIVAKHSRYEYEKLLSPDLTEEQLKKHLKQKGSDYDGLLFRHQVHQKKLNELVRLLETKKTDIHVVNRLNYTKDRVKEADAIFTVGGDGTFLLAASAVLRADTTVIGINSDPERSEGYLCLPKHCSHNLSQALNNLFSGKFKRLRRQRIRVSLISPNNNEENGNGTENIVTMSRSPNTTRIHEHIGEHEDVVRERQDDIYRNPFPIKANPMPLPQATKELDIEHQDRRTILPVRALNEVFFGENISARVSYYELSLDDNSAEKQKSSGVTICTGTGSSSWNMHINELSTDCVQQLLTLAQSHCLTEQKHHSNSLKQQLTSCSLPIDSPQFLKQITDQYNSSLVFDPEKLIMAYSVRDPVRNGIFFVSHPKGFAKRIVARSRMWDSHLVIDGGFSYPFNEGAIAEFEIHPEDALNCIVLVDS